MTTIEYLSTMGIPKERLYIFVQTANDKKEYAIHESRANVILAPADGIAKARNNILRHFSASRNILMMDDDISGISRLRSGKLARIETREEFAQTFNKFFASAQKKQAPIFGIYPVHNAFFMSKSISTAVTVNTVIGFVKGEKLKFDESYKAKEDIELCGRLLNSGRMVLRFNFFAVNAKHRTNAGGCHNTWGSDENKKAVQRLCDTYPNIFAPQKQKLDEVRVVLKDTGKIDL